MLILQCPMCKKLLVHLVQHFYHFRVLGQSPSLNKKTETFSYSSSSSTFQQAFPGTQKPPHALHRYAIILQNTLKLPERATAPGSNVFSLGATAPGSPRPPCLCSFCRTSHTLKHFYLLISWSLGCNFSLIILSHCGLSKIPNILWLDNIKSVRLHPPHLQESIFVGI
jgi:hypothetical protein